MNVLFFICLHKFKKCLNICESAPAEELKPEDFLAALDEARAHQVKHTLQECIKVYEYMHVCRSAQTYLYIHGMPKRTNKQI